jgi:hypothetical protein
MEPDPRCGFAALRAGPSRACGFYARLRLAAPAAAEPLLRRTGPFPSSGRCADLLKYNPQGTTPEFIAELKRHISDAQICEIGYLMMGYGGFG